MYLEMGRYSQGSCGTTYCREGNGKGDVGCLEDIVLAHFHAEEDAPRESAKGIPDAEGRANRCLPWSLEGDPCPANFHRGNAR